MGTRVAMLVSAVLAVVLGVLCLVWSTRVPAAASPLGLAGVGVGFLLVAALVAALASFGGRGR